MGSQALQPPVSPLLRWHLAFALVKVKFFDLHAWGWAQVLLNILMFHWVN